MSLRFLYIESDDPKAAMAALKLFTEGGLPAISLQLEEPDDVDEIEEEADDEEAEDEPDEPSEIDEPTEMEDEPAAAAPLQRHKPKPNWNGGPKPAIVEVLTGSAGMTTGEIIKATGLLSRQVNQCLANHRQKTFERADDGRWSLKANAVEAAPKSFNPVPKKATPGSSQHFTQIHTLLKSDAPLELAEISRMTKIPQADCFRVLADESKFERVDGVYWPVK